MNSKIGLIGRKIGMTQLFDENAEVIPVTVIQLGPCPVLRVKTAGSRDGYDALQLGFGDKKANRTNRPDMGQFKKAGLENALKVVREFRVDAETAAKTEQGTVLTVGDVFAAGDRIDVVGTSKGRGYAGVMKRHHHAGFERSHGVHEFFRHGGSIGTRLTPGMTLKGMKMPGQMGNARVTVQNMVVAKIDTERNLAFIRGGVPGPNGGVVTVRKTVKKA
ncbi:MAG: 50S ribosomal protein L3 [Alphaproteobacteria bacterium]|nr:50S ribosomal protein L3 [Alphaproteobacteria bacterium]MCB9696839.1 50S ribosomal protein L3 [Alphaproteobacteria bacterium]